MTDMVVVSSTQEFDKDIFERHDKTKWKKYLFWIRVVGFAYDIILLDLKVVLKHTRNRWNELCIIYVFSCVEQRFLHQIKLLVNV